MEPLVRESRRATGEMTLAVTVPGLEAAGAGATAELDAGAAATEEAGLDPEEGVEPCFIDTGVRDIAGAEEEAGRDLGEGFAEFTIKFTSDWEGEVAGLDAGGGVFKTGVVLEGLLNNVTPLEGVITVGPSFDTVTVAFLLDWLVRLAWSLRVLSMSFFVLTSCCATLA